VLAVGQPRQLVIVVHAELADARPLPDGAAGRRLREQRLVSLCDRPPPSEFLVATARHSKTRVTQLRLEIRSPELPPELRILRTRALQLGIRLALKVRRRLGPVAHRLDVVQRRRGRRHGVIEGGCRLVSSSDQPLELQALELQDLDPERARVVVAG